MRLRLFILSLIVAGTCFAQEPEVSTDLTGFELPHFEPPLPAIPTDNLLKPMPATLFQSDGNVSTSLSLKAPELRVRSWQVTPVSNAAMVSWNGGAATAFGTTQSMPGLLGIETGGIGLTQSIGNVTFNAVGYAEKYGYFRGLTTSWGFGGSIGWQINDNLSLHAFGQYQTPVRGLPPAIMGYTGTTNFGGFFRWKSSGIFGIDVGAQNTYDPSLNHWRVAPILRPYIELSPGNRLGIDVGGILYELLRGAAGWGPRNPTPTIPRPEIIVR